MKKAIEILKEASDRHKNEMQIAAQDIDRHNAIVKQKHEAAEENENIVEFIKEKLGDANIPCAIKSEHGVLWSYEQQAKTDRHLASCASGDCARATKRYEYNKLAFEEIEQALAILQKE